MTGEFDLPPISQVAETVVADDSMAKTAIQKLHDYATARKGDDEKETYDEIQMRKRDDIELEKVTALAAENERLMAQVMSVSHCFSLLDDLFRQGKVSYSKVAILKGKYQRMVETVKEKRTRYSAIIALAKKQFDEIRLLRREARKSSSLPKTARIECERHRKDLSRIHTNLVESKEKQDDLEFEIMALEEEMATVEKEKARTPDPQQISNLIKTFSSDRDTHRYGIGE